MFSRLLLYDAFSGDASCKGTRLEPKIAAATLCCAGSIVGFIEDPPIRLHMGIASSLSFFDLGPTRDGSDCGAQG